MLVIGLPLATAEATQRRGDTVKAGAKRDGAKKKATKPTGARKTRGSLPRKARAPRGEITSTALANRAVASRPEVAGIRSFDRGRNVLKQDIDLATRLFSGDSADVYPRQAGRLLDHALAVVERLEKIAPAKARQLTSVKVRLEIANANAGTYNRFAISDALESLQSARKALGMKQAYLPSRLDNEALREENARRSAVRSTFPTRF